MPSRMFFAVSCSRWNRISSSSARSVARRKTSARTRAVKPLMTPMVAPAGGPARQASGDPNCSLGSLEDELDGLDVAAPARRLGPDGPPAGGGQPVVLRAPIVLRRAP